MSKETMTDVEKLAHLGRVLVGVPFMQASVSFGEARVQVRHDYFASRFAGREASAEPHGKNVHLKIVDDGIEWVAVQVMEAVTVVQL